MESKTALCQLATEKKARIALTFAGQANDYIRELRDLWQRYSVVKTLVQKVDVSLREEIETPQAVLSGYFSQGLFVEEWLSNENKVPEAEYLFSSPISQPLVLLTQMANYLSLCIEGYDNESVDSWALGATGHSQGVIPAAIVAMGLSFDGIIEETVQATRYLVWQGIRMEEAHDLIASPNESALKELGTLPKYMAAIQGFTSTELQSIIDEFNKGCPSDDFVYLSLDNETLKKVISGAPDRLEKMRLYLEDVYPKKNPFPARNLRFTYLNTSAPFHSPHIDKCIDLVLTDLERIGWEIDPKKIKIPLYSFSDGKDLRSHPDLMREFISLQAVRQLKWKTALSFVEPNEITHIIDFGPGDGIAKLSRAYVSGFGVEVFCVSNIEERNVLISSKNEDIPFRASWKKYAPKMVDQNGEKMLVNNFSKFCGRSPVILPGMTPTTATAEIIVATANAGYLAELAGGGQVTEEMFRKRMDEIVETLDPSQGVVLNTLYLDPYLWNLQVSGQGLLFKLKEEGYPFIGITISAGLPPVEEAVTLLDKLHDSGMFLNAFKAGTDEQIKHILAIAALRPQYTICMHVEGGLAGGHHGWYDVRHVLLKNYQRIREQENVLVLAGGGIREEQDAIDFVMGTWNKEFDLPEMPMDGVFLGTLVMACRESEASDDCKKALVETTGIDDWSTTSGTGEIKGGMTSGKSPLNADIYYVENNAAKIGRLLDNVAGDKEAVAKNREQIVEMLQKTSRPYLGDLNAMSYFTLLDKMVELMAVGSNGRYEDGQWLDITYRLRFEKMLARVLERLSIDIVVDTEQIQQPRKLLQTIENNYPRIKDVPLAPEDQAFFIYKVCQIPGKPVNFIPIIDENIRKWYKSDSLHTCNDPRYKADEVFQTPGPRAVAGIRVVDEPIAELFNRFHKALTQNADELSVNSASDDNEINVHHNELEAGANFWNDYHGDIATLLQAQSIIRGTEIRRNFVHDLLKLAENERIVVKQKNGEISGILMERESRKGWGHILQIESHEKGIELKIFHRLLSIEGEKNSSYTTYFCCDRNKMAPYNIKEVDEGRVERIADFYAGLLLDDPSQVSEKHQKATFDLSEQSIRQYIGSLGGKDNDFSTAPLSMAFVVAWQPLFRILLHPDCVGDFFTLVHLANNIIKVDSFVAGKTYDVEAALESISYGKEGKKVVVIAQISHEKNVVAILESQFLLREKVGSRLGQEQKFSVPFTYPKAEQVALSRPYYAYEKNVKAPLSGDTYSMVSKDFNPLHRDISIARIAGFDSPILHGMWSKGMALQTLREQENICHKDISRIEVQFSAPATHGSKVWTYGRHIAMNAGQKVYEINCATEQNGGRIATVTGKVFTNSSQVALVFPGQGIQAKGMGMESYARSAAVRDVWDRSDDFTRSEFGFSILQIVQQNPGQLIVKNETLRHEKGVLFLTQFTQVALVVHAIASVAELKEAGVYIQDHYFCGHSIGEYSAISACSKVLALEKVISVVYQRGLTMQNFVPRDEQGQSPYRMGVVCPHRAKMSEEQAVDLVNQICEDTNTTLEIVNYNVKGRQYAVAGHIDAIAVLQQRLMKHSSPKKPAYMDIPGLDVPFHSSVLQGGVDHFRKVLMDTFSEEDDLTNLEQRYIPNLVARPFELSKSFFDDVYHLTKSPVMAEILSDVEKSLEDKAVCARKVVIELLAYQFAFPVRWIETQDLLLKNGNISQIWEVGVSYQPTLANMFGQTIGSKSHLAKPVFNVERDRSTLYFLEGETELPSSNVVEEVEEASTVEEKVQEHQPIVKLPVVPTSSGTENLAPPKTSTVKHALRTILALQTKIWPEEMADDESIDQLLGGNSSRRNQTVVDIWTEFNTAPIDGGHEIPLSQLEEAIESATSGRYNSPGAYLKVAHTEAIKRNFDKIGNVTLRDIITFLQENWIIDDTTTFQVLSTISVIEGIDSSSRSNAKSPIDKNIGNRKEAQIFIDSVLQHYKDIYGWSFAAKSAESSGAQVDSAAIDKILERYFGIHGVFAEVARCTQELLGHDPYAGIIEREKEFLEEDRLELYKNEHGPKYERSIRPRFFARKIRSFTSAWNWTRSQITSLYWDLKNNKSCDDQYEFVKECVLANPVPEVQLLVSGFKTKSLQDNNKEMSDIFECLHDLAINGDYQAKRAVYLRPTAPQVKIDEKGLHFSEGMRDKQKDACDFVNSLQLNIQPKNTGKCTSSKASDAFAEVLTEQAKEGITFCGKVALVTGAGERAIATSVVKYLLRGGAKVIVTTTTSTLKRLNYYRELYQQHAGHGAELHIVPFNQGCGSDIRAIVDWIYKPQEGRAAWQLDYFIPFGAVPEENNILTLDEGSVATMRVMLFGLEYLLGKIAKEALEAADPEKKMQVILPLSPNHGQFGNDGMYAETKAGLEVLLNKWKSEYDVWGKTCSIVGAQIGWVRGTGLMSANDVVAAGLESQRAVRTYSCDEMAFLLTGLLHNNMCQIAQKTPLKVNLMGGMEKVDDLGAVLRDIRNDLQKQLAEKKANASTKNIDKVLPLDTNQFPRIPSKEQLNNWKSPQMKLEDTVVIVGYGEVGTFGNAQIRWDQETTGQLSQARALELARVIGLIEFSISPKYVGWLDVETGNPVSEQEVGRKYRDQLVAAIGIRDMDPERAHFDPDNVEVYTEVSLENEVKFRIDDRETAVSYKEANPEKVDFFYDSELDCYWVLLRKAMKIRVPKRMKFDRNVAGQIPSGWSANRMGLPNDMCQQMDSNTQYSLIGTADAFVSAGIEPEELYKYIHPSKVGNTMGSGLGGGLSLARLARDVTLNIPRQGDRIQETLVNVMGAYNVQNYVGSYGTVVSPANACATAAISVEIGMEKILSGKAEFIVAGSYDDLSDTGVLGFKDMNATANNDDMRERGFTPEEMSRPNDVMRSGFVEAQGGGTTLLCRASVALEAGLPVYGVVAMSYSATDGVNQSIPAPGLGLLSVVCEDEKNSSVLRRALEQYGLTADDVALVSKHDTSTEANDKNESELYHSLMQKLGRTPGLPMMVISQKSLTGHSKGGAAAWQMNGVLQAMHSGIVPGNTNLLDVDIRMKKHTFLQYNSSAVHVGSENIKAALITSLGFGHVGAMLCLVHPDAFFKMLSEEDKERYVALRKKRWVHRYERERNFLIGKEKLLTIRDKKPFVANADGENTQEKKMLFSPDYRS
ncbi:fatty acid synthase subunit beta domain-containing protein [Candidatus Uabimicrobium sp. HlEnr_7]|uniref:fatty acid synthase subunit beta domain-containing protein n=1 Tax=Candidatus Uabimicrobium helgolandensis TaxID=3095367 RepID=UPI0035565B0C